jgi:hypothetical protein
MGNQVLSLCDYRLFAAVAVSEAILRCKNAITSVIRQALAGKVSCGTFSGSLPDI